MKRVIIINILLLVGQQVLAQSNHVDSLSSLLDTLQNQSIRVDVLNELARQFNTSDSAQTATYTDEAIRIANQIGYIDGLVLAYARISWANLVLGNYELADALYTKALSSADSANSDVARSIAWNGLGALYYHQSDYEKSIDYFKRSLEIRVKEGNLLAMAGSHNNIGIIYEEWGDFSRALEHYYLSLEQYNDLEDLDGKASILNNMGIIYKKQDEFRKAINFHLESLEMVKSLQFKDRQISSHTNLGTCYSNLNIYDSANYHYEKALEISQEIGSKNGLGHSYQNLGVINYQLGHTKLAEEYFNKSYEIRKELGSKNDVAQTALWLGRLLGQNHRPSQAFDLLYEAYNVATETKSLENVRDASKELYILYKQLGDSHKALKYFTEFHELENELDNKEKTRQLIRAEEQYGFNQRQDSIQFANEKSTIILNERISRQKTFETIFSIGLGLLLVFIFILYRFNRHKTRANKQLSFLNDKFEHSNIALKELNEEKNKLLGIVAHDLRSPLNQIKGFIYLHILENGYSEQKYLDQASQASERLGIMVDRILDVSAIESKRIDLRTEKIEVTSLLEQMAINFKMILNNKDQEIHLANSVEKIYIEADRNYLIQVLENLLSNANKYAKPQTKIYLGAQLEEDTIKIKVKDEGPGISVMEQKELFREFATISSKPTGGEKSTGLGLSIVKKYVEAMEGSIGLNSILGEGSTFYISFRQV
jgi:signal transduction histidine kinase